MLSSQQPDKDNFIKVALQQLTRTEEIISIKELNGWIAPKKYNQHNLPPMPIPIHMPDSAMQPN